jgi:hypothetical protein
VDSRGAPRCLPLIAFGISYLPFIHARRIHTLQTNTAIDADLPFVGALAIAADSAALP